MATSDYIESDFTSSSIYSPFISNSPGITNIKAIAYNGSQWIAAGSDTIQTRSFKSYNEVFTLLDYARGFDASIKTLYVNIGTLKNKNTSGSYSNAISSLTQELNTKINSRKAVLDAAAARFKYIQSLGYNSQLIRIGTLHTMMISSDGINWSIIEENPFQFYTKVGNDTTIPNTLNPKTTNGEALSYVSDIKWNSELKLWIAVGFGGNKIWTNVYNTAYQTSWNTAGEAITGSSDLYNPTVLGGTLSITSFSAPVEGIQTLYTTGGLPNIGNIITIDDAGSQANTVTGLRVVSLNTVNSTFTIRNPSGVAASTLYAKADWGGNVIITGFGTPTANDYYQTVQVQTSGGVLPVADSYITITGANQNNNITSKVYSPNLSNNTFVIVNQNGISQTELTANGSWGGSTQIASFDAPVGGVQKVYVVSTLVQKPLPGSPITITGPGNKLNNVTTQVVFLTNPNPADDTWFAITNTTGVAAPQIYARCTYKTLLNNPVYSNYGVLPVVDNNGNQIASYTFLPRTLFATSPDGITWTPQGMPDFLYNNINNTDARAVASKVACTPGLTLVVGVFSTTFDTYEYICSSIDCQSWRLMPKASSNLSIRPYAIAAEVATNGTLWVIVGGRLGSNVDYIQTSINGGVTWTTRFSTLIANGEYHLRGVAYNGLKWIAVGSRATGSGNSLVVMMSTDGFSWSVTNTTSSGSLISFDCSVAWDGNLWIITSGIGSFQTQDGNILQPLSVTGNAIATTVSLPIVGGTIATVNSLLIGYGQPMSVLRSYNNLDWTPQLIDSDGTNFLGAPQKEFFDVKWCGSFWVLTGNPQDVNLRRAVALSNDGLSWTYPSNIVNEISRPVLTYGRSIGWDGTNIVIVGEGNVQISVSTDNGSTWATQSSPLSGCKTVAWNGYSTVVGVSNFAASSNGQQLVTLTNTTGISANQYITFTNATNPKNNGTFLVLSVGTFTIYCNNTVGISQSETSTVTKAYTGLWVTGGIGGIATSPNRTTWTKSPLCPLDIVYNVAWNGYIWLACGTSATQSIAYSVDGVHWYAVDPKQNPFTTCYAVAWNRSMWIAVGTGTNTLATSVDGLNWNMAGKPAFSTLGSMIAWDGTKWIAGGSGVHPLAFSSDGTTWTTYNTLISKVNCYANKTITLPYIGTSTTAIQSIIDTAIASITTTTRTSAVSEQVQLQISLNAEALAAQTAAQLAARTLTKSIAASYVVEFLYWKQTISTQFNLLSIGPLGNNNYGLYNVDFKTDKTFEFSIVSSLNVELDLLTEDILAHYSKVLNDSNPQSTIDNSMTSIKTIRDDYNSYLINFYKNAAYLYDQVMFIVKTFFVNYNFSSLIQSYGLTSNTSPTYSTVNTAWNTYLSTMNSSYTTNHSIFINSVPSVSITAFSAPDSNNIQTVTVSSITGITVGTPVMISLATHAVNITPSSIVKSVNGNTFTIVNSLGKESLTESTAICEFISYSNTLSNSSTLVGVTNITQALVPGTEFRITGFSAPNNGIQTVTGINIVVYQGTTVQIIGSSNNNNNVSRTVLSVNGNTFTISNSGGGATTNEVAASGTSAYTSAISHISSNAPNLLSTYNSFSSTLAGLYTYYAFFIQVLPYKLQADTYYNNAIIAAQKWATVLQGGNVTITSFSAKDSNNIQTISVNAIGGIVTNSAVTITGSTNANNNGLRLVLSTNGNTFTVSNANGVYTPNQTSAYGAYGAIYVPISQINSDFNTLFNTYYYSFITTPTYTTDSPLKYFKIAYEDYAHPSGYPAHMTALYNNLRGSLEGLDTIKTNAINYAKDKVSLLNIEQSYFKKVTRSEFPTGLVIVTGFGTPNGSGIQTITVQLIHTIRTDLTITIKGASNSGNNVTDAKIISVNGSTFTIYNPSGVLASERTFGLYAKTASQCVLTKLLKLSFYDDSNYKLATNFANLIRTGSIGYPQLYPLIRDVKTSIAIAEDDGCKPNINGWGGATTVTTTKRLPGFTINNSTGVASSAAETTVVGTILGGSISSFSEPDSNGIQIITLKYQTGYDSGNLNPQNAISITGASDSVNNVTNVTIRANVEPVVTAGFTIVNFLIPNPDGTQWINVNGIENIAAGMSIRITGAIDNANNQPNLTTVVTVLGSSFKIYNWKGVSTPENMTESAAVGKVSPAGTPHTFAIYNKPGKAATNQNAQFNFSVPIISFNKPVYNIQTVTVDRVKLGVLNIKGRYITITNANNSVNNHASGIFISDYLDQQDVQTSVPGAQQGAHGWEYYNNVYFAFQKLADHKREHNILGFINYADSPSIVISDAATANNGTKTIYSSASQSFKVSNPLGVTGTSGTATSTFTINAFSAPVNVGGVYRQKITTGSGIIRVGASVTITGGSTANNGTRTVIDIQNGTFTVDNQNGEAASYQTATGTCSFTITALGAPASNGLQNITITSGSGNLKTIGSGVSSYKSTWEDFLDFTNNATYDSILAQQTAFDTEISAVTTNQYFDTSYIDTIYNNDVTAITSYYVNVGTAYLNKLIHDINLYKPIENRTLSITSVERVTISSTPISTKNYQKITVNNLYDLKVSNAIQLVPNTGTVTIIGFTASVNGVQTVITSGTYPEFGGTITITNATDSRNNVVNALVTQIVPSGTSNTSFKIINANGVATSNENASGAWTAPKVNVLYIDESTNSFLVAWDGNDIVRSNATTAAFGDLVDFGDVTYGGSSTFLTMLNSINTNYTGLQSIKTTGLTSTNVTANITAFSAIQTSSITATVTQFSVPDYDGNQIITCSSSVYFQPKTSIKITGAISGNNGTFIITKILGSTQFTIYNTAGQYSNGVSATLTLSYIQNAQPYQTVTVSSIGNIIPGITIRITGASNSGNNGMFTVLSVSGNTFNIRNQKAVSGSTAVGTYNTVDLTLKQAENYVKDIESIQNSIAFKNIVNGIPIYRKTYNNALNLVTKMEGNYDRWINMKWNATVMLTSPYNVTNQDGTVSSITSGYAFGKEDVSSVHSTSDGRNFIVSIPPKQVGFWRQITTTKYITTDTYLPYYANYNSSTKTFTTLPPYDASLLSAYSPQTDYIIDTLVTWNGKIYKCIQDSTDIYTQGINIDPRTALGKIKWDNITYPYLTDKFGNTQLGSPENFPRLDPADFNLYTPISKYSFDDYVSDSGKVYVCIKDFRTDRTIINIPPSDKSIYWTKRTYPIVSYNGNRVEANPANFPVISPANNNEPPNFDINKKYRRGDVVKSGGVYLWLDCNESGFSLNSYPLFTPGWTLITRPLVISTESGGEYPIFKECTSANFPALNPNDYNAYSPTQTYGVDSFASYNGNLYQVSLGVPYTCGIYVTNTKYWRHLDFPLVIYNGEEIEYDPSTIVPLKTSDYEFFTSNKTYFLNDIVSAFIDYSNTTVGVFQCSNDTPITPIRNIPPSVTSYWTPVVYPNVFVDGVEVSADPASGNFRVLNELNYHEYENNWLYYEGDVVSYNGKVYECINVDPNKSVGIYIISFSAKDSNNIQTVTFNYISNDPVSNYIAPGFILTVSGAHNVENTVTNAKVISVGTFSTENRTNTITIINPSGVASSSLPETQAYGVVSNIFENTSIKGISPVKTVSITTFSEVTNRIQTITTTGGIVPVEGSITITNANSKGNNVFNATIISCDSNTNTFTIINPTGVVDSNQNAIGTYEYSANKAGPAVAYWTEVQSNSFITDRYFSAYNVTFWNPLTTHSYAVGSIVMWKGILYKCQQAVSYQNFIPGVFTSQEVAEIISTYVPDINHTDWKIIDNASLTNVPSFYSDLTTYETHDIVFINDIPADEDVMTSIGDPNRIRVFKVKTCDIDYPVEYKYSQLAILDTVDEFGFPNTGIQRGTENSYGLPRYGIKNNDPFGIPIFAARLKRKVLYEIQFPYLHIKHDCDAFLNIFNVVNFDNVVDGNYIKTAAYNFKDLPVKPVNAQLIWNSLLDRGKLIIAAFKYSDRVPEKYETDSDAPRILRSFNLNLSESLLSQVPIGPVVIVNSVGTLLDKAYSNLIDYMKSLKDDVVYCQTKINEIKTQYFNMSSVQEKIALDPYPYLSIVALAKSPPQRLFKDLGVGDIEEITYNLDVRHNHILSTEYERQYYYHQTEIIDSYKARIASCICQMKFMVNYGTMAHYTISQPHADIRLPIDYYFLDGKYAPDGLPVGPFIGAALFILGDMDDKYLETASYFTGPTADDDTTVYGLINNATKAALKPPEYTLPGSLGASLLAVLTYESKIPWMVELAAATKGAVGIIAGTMQNFYDPTQLFGAIEFVGNWAVTGKVDGEVTEDTPGGAGFHKFTSMIPETKFANFNDRAQSITAVKEKVAVYKNSVNVPQLYENEENDLIDFLLTIDRLIYFNLEDHLYLGQGEVKTKKIYQKTNIVLEEKLPPVRTQNFTRTTRPKPPPPFVSPLQELNNELNNLRILKEGVRNRLNNLQKLPLFNDIVVPEPERAKRLVKQMVKDNLPLEPPFYPKITPQRPASSVPDLSVNGANAVARPLDPAAQSFARFWQSNTGGAEFKDPFQFLNSKKTTVTKLLAPDNRVITGAVTSSKVNALAGQMQYTFTEVLEDEVPIRIINQDVIDQAIAERDRISALNEEVKLHNERVTPDIESLNRELNGIDRDIDNKVRAITQAQSEEVAKRAFHKQEVKEYFSKLRKHLEQVETNKIATAEARAWRKYLNDPNASKITRNITFTEVYGGTIGENRSICTTLDFQYRNNVTTTTILLEDMYDVLLKDDTVADMLRASMPQSMVNAYDDFVNRRLALGSAMQARFKKLIEPVVKSMVAKQVANVYKDIHKSAAKAAGIAKSIYRRPIIYDVSAKKIVGAVGGLAMELAGGALTAYSNGAYNKDTYLD